MKKFEVWAPLAKSVAVQVDGRSRPMESGQDGWWTALVESAQPGQDYGFSLDGSDPLPDPRSGFQPYGVHGLSRLVDHGTFQWSDKNWQARPLSSAVVYELHVGTFTPAGTFIGLIEKLDYLVDLGITHVELMPINEFSGDWGWGYDGVDLFAPHYGYGSPDDLKQLVNACHAKGLAVLLDVVYNHLGPTGNYLSRFGPYFTEAYRTPWGAAVNLDHKSSVEIRRFFADNALMWLRDYHFDGLRLDAVHAYYDHSAIPFLEQLATEVDGLSAHLGRHFVLVAESDLNDPRLITSRDAGGFGLDAQWSDDFHHALHTVLTGETTGYYEDFGSLAALGTALKEAFVYSGAYSDHRQRLHGRKPMGVSGHRFLGYAQNHDQIGNRATGERLSHLISVGRLKIAAALVFTSPFVPMLFQGEEFGSSSPFQYFTHHEDVDLARQVSHGRSKEFQAFGWKPEDVPDPQDPATFQRSKLRWEEVAEQHHADLLNWHKRLLRLRREHFALTDGRLDLVEVQCDEQAQWLSVRRGPVEVVCNLSSERQSIPIRCSNKEVVCSEPDWLLRPDHVELPADSVAILTAAQAAEVHQRSVACGG